MGNPILYIVIPCYNEEAVLPLTSGMFLKKIKDLAAAGRISDKSRILFVNDGSKDKTWDIIRSLAEADEHYRGVCLSRNRGHQNALLAGLMTAKDLADVTISIDCDGQDDINAMDAMIDEYLAGMDVVYGVRSKRETDTWFKRTTAEGFYKVMKALGADVVFNHADYRLLSKRALEGLAEFRTSASAHICLRPALHAMTGIFPLRRRRTTAAWGLWTVCCRRRNILRMEKLLRHSPMSR